MQFIDLKRQYDRIGNEINDRIQKVLNEEKFIMGPEFGELEEKLAQYTGRKHAFVCGSGTDALVIPLMAYELEKTDAVFVPAFTFFASAESVSLAGGTPVFVDSRDDFNIDCDDLEKQICKTIEEGRLKPRGIIAVDLFGQAADYDLLQKIADKYNLFLLEDGAQSMGGEYKNRKNGSFGDVSATSFFPAKPLGCYGDGGAIFTDDDELAAKIYSIRVHGQGSSRYDNIRIGINGRMDTLQAAILLPKLAILDEEIKLRQNVAKIYMDELKDVFKIPTVADHCLSAWAQFTLQAKDEKQRNLIVEGMKKYDIPIMIYYIMPMHMQTAFKSLEYKKQDIPNAVKLSERVFSVPMYPYLKTEEIIHICDCLKKIIAEEK